MTHVRYFAGAAAAVGCEEEQRDGQGPALAVLIAAHPAAEAVLRRCSLLHEGRALRPEAPWPVAGCLDVLPPFAGG